MSPAAKYKAHAKGVVSKRVILINPRRKHGGRGGGGGGGARSINAQGEIKGNRKRFVVINQEPWRQTRELRQTGTQRN